MKKLIICISLCSLLFFFALFTKSTSAITASVPESGNQEQNSLQNESEDSNLQIRLHERFIKNNSSTTRIDNMNQEQLREVKEFTIEEANMNKVQFKNTFNFSDNETVEKLNKLSEYVNLSTIGKVTIDTDYLDILEGEATITMYDLPFNTTPLIYKDGKLVTNEEVSNVSYVYSHGKKTGVLTFSVTRFSTYEAKENEQNIYYELNDAIEESDNSLQKILLLIGLITVQGIIVAVLVKLIEMKRIKKYKEGKRRNN